MSDLGNCPKCGAENKLSQKGKPYCSAKCWLNEGGGGGNTYQSGGFGKQTDKQKSDGQSWGNAKTNATFAIIEMYKKGDVQAAEVWDKIVSFANKLHVLEPDVRYQSHSAPNPAMPVTPEQVSSAVNQIQSDQDNIDVSQIPF